MILSVFNSSGFGVSLFYFHLNHHDSQREFLPHSPLLGLTWTSSTFSAHSGVVLSVEEVEAGLKGLKMDQQVKNSTPFMAEHLEETLSAITSNRQLKKDGDMTTFNKLMSSMSTFSAQSQPKP